MSLRGKIEAVLYAAEEPVTLAQLAALFGEETLAFRAERTAGNAPEPEGEAAPGTDEQSAPSSLFEPEANAPETASPAGETLESALARRAARSREREARAALQLLLQELIAEYDASDRGMEIREIAGGFRIATKPEYHDAVRVFAKSLKPPIKLSLPALETLAVIAYKQPVTSPEVSEIRGVDSAGVLGSLIGRKLVTTAGRKQVVGRPILYKTTKEFLLRFGLKDLHELPSMEEFEKMAGELEALGEEPSAPVQPAALLLPVSEASAAPEGESTAQVAVDEVAPGPAAIRLGEKPRLGPSRIEIAIEEPEAPGLSINRSGVAVSDRAESVPHSYEEEQHG